MISASQDQSVLKGGGLSSLRLPRLQLETDVILPPGKGRP
jgi:hypothetical protein